jgi:hypothetical protein
MPDVRINSLLTGSIWRRARGALALAQVRIRIPVVLVIAAVLVGRWDVVRNYWDRLTRASRPESIALHAVSADTEYFCPMDPGVLSDWPGRCGVCNMALVRRKRGEALALPDGVIARMQLSPYRIQLAGIQTTPAAFRPLAREFESSALIAREREVPTIQLEIPARHAPWVATGQVAKISCSDLPGRDPLKGRVQSVDRAQIDGWEYLRASIAIIDPPRDLRAGMTAVARLEIPLAELEPFRSLPSDPPPLSSGEARVAYVCPEHLDSVAAKAGRCPLDQNRLEPRSLSDYQRLRWWCPMHPNVTAERPEKVCEQCGGMLLKPRVLTYRPVGQVLAVPRSAVVDTGVRKVVFVESMPGMFDGVAVELGPRSGDFYPVVRGLEVGQRVASAGAFLLDAETRLNPSLASGYFGAGRGEHGVVPAAVAATTGNGPYTLAAALQGFGPEDRFLAERQKLCPVTSKALGSMGAPARIVVSGRVVFLCCGGCEDALRRESAKYMAKLPAE